jgi:RimJ/RimL family protein N-acetyltransferase
MPMDAERDAAFILRLLNEPSFLQYVGDKHVRTLDDARDYIVNGPVESYATNGFGLYLVRRSDDSTSVGICGLVKREALEHPDIGFAFLPEFWRRGYATEAAAAVLGFSRDSLALERVVAITAPHNEPSIRVLGKIGMTFRETVYLTPDRPEVRLFSIDL